MFKRKGLIRVPKENYDEEELLMVALEAGAEDLKVEDEFYEIYTSFEDFDKVKTAFEEQGISVQSAELTMIPQSTVKLEGKQAEQMLKLMEILDDHDDVQNVYANFDIDDEVMAQIMD